jgi:hypothetical protein
MISGWLLTALVVMLAVHHWRSQFYLAPWGRISHWRRVHAGAGLFAVPLLIVHVMPLRSVSTLEIALLSWFALCAGGGLLAWRWSHSTPREVTRAAGNQLLESIPSEIARLRADADALVLQRVRDTGNRALAVAYRRDVVRCLSLGARCSERAWQSLSEDPTRDELAALLDRARGLNSAYHELLHLRIVQIVHVAAGYALLVFLPLHILDR